MQLFPFVGCSLLWIASLVLAQANGSDQQSNGVDFDNRFTVETRNCYKVLTNNILNERYALVSCNVTDDLSGYQAVVQVPVKRVGVTNALDILPLFELLAQQNIVVSVTPAANVTSPCYGNFTNGSVDVMFMDQPVRNNNSTDQTPIVGVSSSSTDLHPLEKAAWIMYIAQFLDAETDATSIMHNIKMDYNCNKANIASAGNLSLAWTYYDAGKREWSLLGDRYHSSLTLDAGFTSAVDGTRKFTNISDLHEAMKGIQYVIDVTPLENLNSEQSASYSDWLRLGGFLPGQDAFTEPFRDYRQMFRMDGLVNDEGYSDWPERSAARPDLVLRDMIQMAYPTYDQQYRATWMRNFAKSTSVKTVSETTYPSCSDPIKRLTVCKSGVYKPSPSDTGDSGDNDSSNPKSGLSTGGKVGIAIGVIAGVAGAGVAGFFLYRRKQSSGTRPFYKMNDL
ncbi:uncharacterized protein BYT42DRAFT_556682 [Radiomyces spectabilis]|uniref:uncharacterized protein n=1 Tax=Radiomyces spectabilis TaxID=64574 RepID=UPI00221F997A|nr:uncharacterized protein BYT42DRAFT_556682 [Radiomyces spectabilis]KAI8391381.1 hypothetical protein BYT42DRAFT_556682 [Radiomyces spectabilis]